MYSLCEARCATQGIEIRILILKLTPHDVNSGPVFAGYLQKSVLNRGRTVSSWLSCRCYNTTCSGVNNENQSHEGKARVSEILVAAGNNPFGRTLAAH